MTPARLQILKATIDYLQYNCGKINPLTGKPDAGKKIKITNKESIQDYLEFIYTLPVDYVKQFHPFIQVQQDWSELKITRLPDRYNAIRGIPL